MKTATCIQCLAFLCICFYTAAASDSTKVRKNEIGLNIKSPLVLSMKGSMHEHEIGLYFKRVLKKSAFRSYVGISTRDVSFPDFEEALSDSSTKTSYTTGNRGALLLRAGIEKRKVFPSRLFVAAGLDLLARSGWGNLERGSYVITYYADSVANDQYETIRKVRFSSIGIGTGLSLSLGIPLGNRFLLTFENRTNIYCDFKKEKTYEVQTNQESTEKQRGIDATFEGLMSTVTVNYKF